MSETVRAAYRVSGRVQAVGFRWWAANIASRLNLRGWVRNAEDGAVETEVEGAAAAVQRFKAALHEGPPAARVEAVQEAPISSKELPYAFRVVH